MTGIVQPHPQVRTSRTHATGEEPPDVGTFSGRDPALPRPRPHHDSAATTAARIGVAPMKRRTSEDAFARLDRGIWVRRSPRTSIPFWTHPGRNVLQDGPSRPHTPIR